MTLALSRQLSFYCDEIGFFRYHGLGFPADERVTSVRKLANGFIVVVFVLYIHKYVTVNADFLDRMSVVTFLLG